MPSKIIRLLMIGVAGYFICPLSVSAQNVGDVASPDVDPGQRQISWRTGFRPQSDERSQGLAQRLHIQWATQRQMHFRLGVLATGSGGEALRFANVFGEVNWQTHEHQTAGFDSSVRFDVQIADLDRGNHRARLTWLAQKSLAKDWQIRINLGVGRQFGAGADNALALSGGAMLSRRISGSHRLGWEALGDTGSEVLTTGPIATGPLGGDWSYQLAASAGLSDRAAPLEYRLFLVRGF
jgi:hypothetical protein